MLDKTFDHAREEARIAAAWEAANAFACGREGTGDSYTIVIPPPNVTGSLHMGHALNNTLQDVLCRWKRMQGFDVLWQPGTDHAGIATQMVVERQLAAAGEPTRRELGREAFVEKVWAWKEQSGGTIIHQLKRLGASCDWSRERFTMDEGLSRAVVKVFVELYNQGLIYRDKRLVNWDPHFETAISDLEVENREVDGQMWHFKYPLENGETYEYIERDADGEIVFRETRDYISIATTRPETMLGDGAVAVHPSDTRYAPIVGKRCLLPLAERYIPIVADDYPDPEFGSGAVKITGAHDFNDYQVARRHDIELYVLFDNKAHLLDAPYVPEKYRGMDRFDAREAIVADLEARGLMITVENKKITQPFGDRSGVVIEPHLMDQWYVDAPALAAGAVRVVERGDTVFTPRNWEKTYFEWMRNIEPWCVSRQLWWGHQIPVWYAEDGTPFCAESEAAATALARAKFGRDVALTRDPDVLDTWFSAALWPFSTLGWPDETPELAHHYRTDVLVTGFDIIFFWVARMMMMGLHFMKEVPFNDIYIHALVRDEKGRKMSKSTGNVIDPLELIDAFGADALRFSLLAMAAQGRDIKLSRQRVEGYRNFTTKLWNAARFCLMNDCRRVAEFDPAADKPALTLNRWLYGETARTAAAVDAALSDYRFNEAALSLYRFIWNVFCDWWVEAAKPILQGDDAAARDETRAMGAWAIDQMCGLLHPFAPFITETLWAREDENMGLLCHAPWPQPDLEAADPEADAEMGWLTALVSEIRSLRSEMNVPAGAKIPVLIKGAAAQTRQRVERHRDLAVRLARLERLELLDETAAEPAGCARFVLDEATALLPLAEVIDIGAETTRLKKEVGKLDAEMSKLSAKLANPGFLAKAPDEVVAENRERLADADAARARLSEALSRLSAAG